MNGHIPLATTATRSAIILYGTETGTSQDLAEELSRCLERLHFSVDVVGLETVAFTILHSYTLSVFVIATTGQGDFPANARKFWTSLLRKKLGKTTLNGVRYALVGLGDSSYLKFNWAARKLEKRLCQLGAREVVEACEADEQSDEGIDGGFLAWLGGFREVVLGRFPLGEGVDVVGEKVELRSKWVLREVGEDSTFSNRVSPAINETNGGEGLDMGKFTVEIEKNKRVTPASHWQDVRFLRLRTVGNHDYLPGDALAINPENMPRDVNTLLDLMQWQHVADTPVAIVRNNSNPTQTLSPLAALSAPLSLSGASITLRQLLTKHLDIKAIPRRSFFTAIAKYTSDQMHKERLLEFTDPQYLDEYYDYATRPRRSIIEVLQEFDTVKIPWQEAINVFPILRPRQFSIASGGALKTNAGETIFELLVAIVKYKTIIKRIREGVCTSYLAQLPIGTKLNIELKTEGRFSSKSDITTKNHLLIGAGTGIAPLRSLIHEKYIIGEGRGKTVLVFGARNVNSDYFFEDEWSKMRSEVFEVHTAFSRDQMEKVYVQDKIRERYQLVREMLYDPEVVIIVCGASGQMPKAVRQALVDVLTGAVGHIRTEGRSDIPALISINEAEQFLGRLEKEGRYKQETWS